MSAMDKSYFQNIFDNAIGPIIHKVDHGIYLKLNNLLSEHDITLQQTMVLTFLWLNKDKEFINQKSVEEHMEIKGPSVTSLIHKMVEKDLVKRSQDEKDGRNFKLKITEKGIELNHICFSTFAQVNHSLIKNISEDEIQTLKHLLNKIAANI